MVETGEERDTPVDVPSPPAAPTRAELEQRVDSARESMTETVEQIKGTVEGRIDSVKDMVSGVLSMSQHFEREPVAWSLGALSAGFTMGYTLGRAHHAKTGRGRPSGLARLADDVAAELATFGSSLLSPAFTAELESSFGVDLSAALARIAKVQPAKPRRLGATPKRARPRPKRSVKGRAAKTTRRR